MFGFRRRLDEYAGALQRGAHPANRTAVDSRRFHADEEPAIESGIPGEKGLVAIEIQLHL
jgi:hypothetical protein